MNTLVSEDIPILQKLKVQKYQLLPWFYISIFSLLIAGIFSIFVVFLRTPYLQEIFPKSMFNNSLAVHVDLSVLIWMLSMQAIFWSIYNSSKYINAIAIIMAFLGMGLISISPFLTLNKPALLNNYVPVIDNLTFFVGLYTFILGILIIAINSLNNYINNFNFTDIYSNLFASTSVIYVFAVFSLLLSINSLRTLMSKESYTFTPYEYYEYMFWGFGHIIQFVYMQTFIGVLLIILNKYFTFSKKFNVIFNILVWLNLSAVLMPVIQQFKDNNVLGDYILNYTSHMRHFGGILFTIVMLLNINKLYNFIFKIKNFEKTGVICSLLLFIFGGILGFLITTSSVVIPAHYHGSIIGITILLMLFAYFLLNNVFNFDYQKLMKKQLIIYTFGQIIHVSGLAWSGGYGVLRKDPNKMLDFKAKLSMGLMGAGGLIAIIGGLTFIIIMLKYALKINKK